ncbi:MAG: hypothetical protein ACYCU7_18860 [Acidimicrobiales bacterium]
MADIDIARTAAIEAVEKLVASHVALFAPEVEMPALADWVLVVAHDSAIDPTAGGVYRLNASHQSTYRSAGLLQMAVDEYRGVCCEDD